MLVSKILRKKSRYEGSCTPFFDRFFAVKKKNPKKDTNPNEQFSNVFGFLGFFEKNVLSDFNGNLTFTWGLV